MQFAKVHTFLYALDGLNAKLNFANKIFAKHEIGMKWSKKHTVEWVYLSAQPEQIRWWNKQVAKQIRRANSNEFIHSDQVEIQYRNPFDGNKKKRRKYINKYASKQRISMNHWAQVCPAEFVSQNWTICCSTTLEIVDIPQLMPI